MQVPSSIIAMTEEENVAPSFLRITEQALRIVLNLLGQLLEILRIESTWGLTFILPILAKINEH